MAKKSLFETELMSFCGENYYFRCKIWEHVKWFHVNVKYRKLRKVKVFSYNLVAEHTVSCCHISCSYSDKVVKTNLIVNSRCPYITIMVNKKVLLLWMQKLLEFAHYLARGVTYVTLNHHMNIKSSSSVILNV